MKRAVSLMTALVVLLVSSWVASAEDASVKYAENSLTRKGIDLSDTGLIFVIRESSSTTDRVHAIRLLASRGDKYADTLKEIAESDKSLQVRIEALSSMAKHDPEFAKKGLKKEMAQCKVASDEIRIAERLADLKDPASLPVLKKYLKAGAAGEKELDIAESLAKMGDSYGVFVFKEYLRSEDNDVCKSAVLVSPAFCAVQTNLIQDLLQVMESSTRIASKANEDKDATGEAEILVRLICAALKKIGDKGCIPSIVRISAEASPFLKEVMDETVKQLTAGTATPPEDKAQMTDEMLMKKNGYGTDEQSLRTAIEKSDSTRVRMSAIRLLGAKEQSTDFLKKVAQEDKSVAIRVEAIKVLGAKQSDFVKPILKECLKQVAANDPIGIEISVRLAEMNDPSGAGYVIKEMKSPEPSVRLAAIGCAPKFVRFDPNVIPTLVSCMESAAGKADDGDGQSAMEVEIIRSALRNAGYTNKVALPSSRPTE